MGVGRLEERGVVLGLGEPWGEGGDRGFKGVLGDKEYKDILICVTNLCIQRNHSAKSMNTNE